MISRGANGGWLREAAGAALGAGGRTRSGVPAWARRVGARLWPRARAAWLAVALLAFPGAAADAPKPETTVVLVKGHVFELELATTPATRERGLMERPELPPDRGMLFVFPHEEVRRFWMKHTRIDLDIIYLDSTGTVVSATTMHAEAPQGEREPEDQYEDRLPLYPSAAPARFAIELASGTLDLLRLEPGDRIDLDLDRLREAAR